jgi:hypothetical protein
MQTTDPRRSMQMVLRKHHGFRLRLTIGPTQALLCVSLHGL